MLLPFHASCDFLLCMYVPYPTEAWPCTRTAWEFVFGLFHEHKEDDDDSLIHSPLPQKIFWRIILRKIIFKIFRYYFTDSCNNNHKSFQFQYLVWWLRHRSSIDSSLGVHMLLTSLQCYFRTIGRSGELITGKFGHINILPRKRCSLNTKTCTRQ